MEREPSDAAIEPYRQALGELRADFHRIVQIAAQHDAEAGQVKLPGGSDE
jgi:hypothetical protein